MIEEKTISNLKVDELLATLTELLSREFPGKLFQPVITESGKYFVSEFDSSTGKVVYNYLEYRATTNTIGNARPWKDKKKQLLVRIVADEACAKHGLLLSGSWFGSFLNTEPFSSFQEAGFEEPVLFLSQTVRRIYRELESIPNLHYSLSEAGNFLQGHYWETSFIAKYFFTTEGIVFWIQNPSVKPIVRVSDTTEGEFFYLDYQKESDLKRLLPAALKTLRMKNMFGTKKESLFVELLRSRVLSKYPQNEKFERAVIRFLCSELNVSEKQLDHFYFSGNPTKLKKKIAIGDYRLGMFPSTQSQNRVFVYSTTSNTYQILDQVFNTKDPDLRLLYLYRPAS